jgi:hypothetical protein
MSPAAVCRRRYRYPSPADSRWMVSTRSNRSPGWLVRSAAPVPVRVARRPPLGSRASSRRRQPGRSRGPPVVPRPAVAAVRRPAALPARVCAGGPVARACGSGPSTISHHVERPGTGCRIGRTRAGSAWQQCRTADHVSCLFNGQRPPLRKGDGAVTGAGHALRARRVPDPSPPSSGRRGERRPVHRSSAASSEELLSRVHGIAHGRP